MADSGMTLTTFNPLPNTISLIHHTSADDLPAYKLRMPPACHSSFVAPARGRHAFNRARTMLPCFAAATASSVTLVCAMR